MTAVFAAIASVILTQFANWYSNRKKRKRLVYDKIATTVMRIGHATTDDKVLVLYGEKNTSIKGLDTVNDLHKNDDLHIIDNLYTVDIYIVNPERTRIKKEYFDDIEKPFTIQLQGKGKILGAKAIPKPKTLIPPEISQGFLDIQEKMVSIQPISFDPKNALIIRLLIGDMREDTDQIVVDIRGDFEKTERATNRWTFPSLTIGLSLLITSAMFGATYVPAPIKHLYVPVIILGLTLLCLSFINLVGMGFIKELINLSKINTRIYQKK